MTQGNIVLEYSITGLPIANGHKIRLYEDGKVEEIGIGVDTETMEIVDGKTLKKLAISPERVQSYAERLVENDFFGYNPPASLIFDGLEETMKLNYQGRTRTIESGNQEAPMLFPEIVRELEALVEQA